MKNLVIGLLTFVCTYVPIEGVRKHALLECVDEEKKVVCLVQGISGQALDCERYDA